MNRRASHKVYAVKLSVQVHGADIHVFVMKTRHVLITAIAVVMFCAESCETAVTEDQFPACTSPLGLSSGLIPDQQITASSTSNREGHSSHLGRLNRIPTTDGWCSSAPKEKKGYLEVDLGTNMRISAISTTGVMVKNDTSGNFTYMYVSKYFLAYKRDSCKRWRHYREDETSVTLFETKNISYRPVPQKHYLLSPRIARYVRFVADEGVGDRWCLKVEVYGCPWKNQDGLVSYKMSQGNKREDVPKAGSSGLRDISYDGHRLAYGTKVGVLSNGLGQLVDGVLGLPADWNNTRDAKWINWIGWHDTVTHRPSVTFQFSSLRQFTALRIHVLNYPGISEKMMFNKLVISFSKDGEYYSWEVIYEPSITKRRQMKDRAFWISVDLKDNVAQHVTCEFYYQGWWTLISEVQFESSLVQGSDDELSTPSVEASSVDPSIAYRNKFDVTVNESTKEKEMKRLTPEVIIFIVSGGIVAAVLVLLAVWLCKRKTRRTEATDNNALLSLRIINPGKKNSLNRKNDPRVHEKMISKKLEELRKEELEDEEEVFYKMNNMRSTELEEDLLKENGLDTSKNLRPKSREISIEEEKAEVLAEMRRTHASFT